MTESNQSPDPAAGPARPDQPQPWPPSPPRSSPPPAQPPGPLPPGPAGSVPAGQPPGRRWPGVVVPAAVVAGTALLGAAGGLIWAAVAPRAQLVMVAPGAAGLVHAETSAFIVGDAWFALIMIVGGVISGLLGYLLAVRRYGAWAMAAVLAGAVAAAFLARLVGEQPGHAEFQHLLASLPVGAHLNDALTLGAVSALAFWPLAAGLVAGGIDALRASSHGRRGLAPPAWPGQEGPGIAGSPPGEPGPA